MKSGPQYPYIPSGRDPLYIVDPVHRAGSLQSMVLRDARQEIVNRLNFSYLQPRKIPMFLVFLPYCW